MGGVKKVFKCLVCLDLKEVTVGLGKLLKGLENNDLSGGKLVEHILSPAQLGAGVVGQVGKESSDPVNLRARRSSFCLVESSYYAG